MSYFQVDYRIQKDGFAQVEADSEEDAIRMVSEGLDGDIVTIDAFALAESA